MNLSNIWRMGTALTLLGAAAANLGCGGMYNQEAKDDLARRVQFEMNCPKDRLRFTPLDSTQGFITSYGVSGCGQKAVYVYVQDKWVLNSESSSKK